MTTVTTMNNISSQNGGMKIIVKNDRGEDTTIRKVRDIREFTSIFSRAVGIDVVSVDSLTGFILRITLPADATPFRSDVFNERGELMNADEYQLPSTGQTVTQHILKCCIVQPQTEPKISPFASGRYKATCTLSEIREEYTNQSEIYDATLAYGGMPICPDIYALMIFNLTEFRETFFTETLSPTHVSTLPPIQTNVFRENDVFRYLLRQLEAPLPPTTKSGAPFERSVGIILMESLPPSYIPLKELKKQLSTVTFIGGVMMSSTLQKKLLFIAMTERALAMCVILFYRTGYIPLDSHLGNWMYDITQMIEQFKLRAIDFGRVVSCKLTKNMDNIQNDVRQYIRSYKNISQKNAIISGFSQLLGITSPRLTTAQECGTKVGEVITALKKLIRRNLNGSILWNPTGARIPVTTKDATSSSPAKTMDVDSCMILIHKIVFIIAIVDSCYNTLTYANHHFCQLHEIFSILFIKKCNNITNMVHGNVCLDLVTYLNSIDDYAERSRIIESYGKIRDYIGGYLRISPERGLFLDPLYEDASPNTPEDPAIVAARPPPPPPPVPPPPPPLLHRSPRTPRTPKSPRKLKVEPLFGLHTARSYERFIADHVSPRVKSSPSRKSSSYGGGGAGGGYTKKKIIKLRKSIKPKRCINRSLSKKLTTKKNKNHNRYRRKYRL